MAFGWILALLLGLVRQGSSQESSSDEKCALGIIGKSVVLPCEYKDLHKLISSNISVQWQRQTGEVVRSWWTQGQNEGIRPTMEPASRVTMVSLGPNTGDFSMKLSEVTPSDAGDYSLHASVDGGKTSSVLCTLCLRVGAHYSFPVIQRAEATPEGKTQFVCHSRGGYPQPVLHWLINDTVAPPQASVRTHIEQLPDSQLYNATSILTVSVPKHVPVACSVKNPILNESLNTTNWADEEETGKVVARASEAMWVFTTVIFIVVSLLVAMGVLFQVKWDRDRRRPPRLHTDTDSEDTDVITIDLERLDSLTETDL